MNALEVASRPSWRRRLLPHATFTWTAAMVQVFLLAEVLACSVWSGRWFAAEFAIPGSAAFALVGALIAAQNPTNRIGWLMMLLPAPGLIAFLGTEYAGLGPLLHVTLPGAAFVSWVSEWIWTPSVGVALSMLTVRFPDGRVPARGRLVDATAIVGTSLFGGGIAWNALAGGALEVTAGQAAMVAVGLVLIAIGALLALNSMAWRYRNGDKELRLQIRWVLLATIVVTGALVFAAVLELSFSARHEWALAPFFAALICVPVAIGVAILRHRLFDVDLIISRTIVYVLVTGALGGLYIAIIEFMQQLSILYTGQRSETAIVLTAFLVAGAFTPVQKWAEAIVERRFRRGDVAARLHSVSASAESAVRVIDPHRFAQWLVDESVGAFEAEGGALYLYGYDRSDPFHCSGTIAGDPSLDIRISHGDEEIGRLVLGRRRGGVDYSRRDVDALKRSGAALGEALALASDLGHLPHPEITGVASNGAGGAVRARGATAATSTRG